MPPRLQKLPATRIHRLQPRQEKFKAPPLIPAQRLNRLEPSTPNSRAIPKVTISKRTRNYEDRLKKHVVVRARYDADAIAVLGPFLVAPQRLFRPDAQCKTGVLAEAEVVAGFG